MGLLERWSKKSTTERLEKTSEPKSEVKAEETGKVVKAKAVAKKTVAKKDTKTKKAVKEVSEENHEGHDHEGHDHSHAPKIAKIKSSILVRPLVTEKSAVKQAENKYSFIVANSANKSAVAKAVFEVYGVKPVAVNMINVQGKPVRFGNHTGKRSDYKKAIVSLPKGKTIVIHEGV